ncbi:amidohydrolase family protein [Schauerella aestuarii]|uniref:amidohydrolase family protein n=1 Tax=Schauerella aestuarii TaxID=2511204 RepID=UPI00136A4050|nr:amidohydrolase family protein [Achromobacter aestuarii]MYZ42719.1 dihydroorotase [Achromobacter aestuarii]
MRTHVAGGRVIDPASGLDAVADIWIADGVIVGVGKPPSGFEADRRIDATGFCVLPGLVDLSFTPGPANDWLGAFAGGITTVAVGVAAGAVFASSAAATPHRTMAPRLLPVGPMCADVSNQHLSDFGRLRQSGCIAWSPGRPVPGRHGTPPMRADARSGLNGGGKDRSDIADCEPSRAERTGSAVIDPHVLWRAMQYARGLGGALWLPPVDAALAQGGVGGAGAYAARLGLDSVPVVAETLALAQIFALQRDTGARVHLSQITSAEGVALVREAKREGLPVTCDVAAHHLHVIDLDIGFYDPRYRLDPPLRGSRDRDALRAGVADGTIDAVCSHHRVVPPEHADAPFAYAAAGAADGPLLASLVLKWARETGVSPVQALARITIGPAAVVAATQPALPRAGRLEVGVPADFCLFDIDDFWLVPAGEPDGGAAGGATGAATGAAFYGRTPFSGMPMTGRVTATYIHGECVWRAAQ